MRRQPGEFLAHEQDEEEMDGAPPRPVVRRVRRLLRQVAVLVATVVVVCLIVFALESSDRQTRRQLLAQAIEQEEGCLIVRRERAAKTVAAIAKLEEYDALLRSITNWEAAKEKAELSISLQREARLSIQQLSEAEQREAELTESTRKLRRQFESINLLIWGITDRELDRRYNEVLRVHFNFTFDERRKNHAHRCGVCEGSILYDLRRIREYADDSGSKVWDRLLLDWQRLVEGYARGMAV